MSNTRDLLALITSISNMLEEGVENIDNETTMKLYRDVLDLRTKVVCAKLKQPTEAQRTGRGF